MMATFLYRLLVEPEDSTVDYRDIVRLTMISLSVLSTVDYDYLIRLLLFLFGCSWATVC